MKTKHKEKALQRGHLELQAEPDGRERVIQRKQTEKADLLGFLFGLRHARAGSSRLCFQKSTEGELTPPCFTAYSVSDSGSSYPETPHHENQQKTNVNLYQQVKKKSLQAVNSCLAPTTLIHDICTWKISCLNVLFSDGKLSEKRYCSLILEQSWML